MSRIPNCRVPTEILSHIFSYVSGNDFASLTRCNRLFYQLCNPLLYRDLYIHTPRQLARLLEEKGVIPWLQRTDSMFIDDWVLCSRAWDEIEAPFIGARSLGCLINLWKATPSLRWLQVYRSDLPRAGTDGHEFRYDLDVTNWKEERSKLIGDLTLLPRLTFVVSYARGHSSAWTHGTNPLVAMARNRQVIYTSSANDGGMMVKVDYGPLANAPENSSQLVSGDSEGMDWSTFRRKFVAFVRSSVQFPVPVRTSLGTSPQRIVVAFSNLKNTLSTQDICRWTRDLVNELRPAVTLPNLKHITLWFCDLSMPNQSIKLEEQNALFELIDRVAPEITNVGLRFDRQSLSRRWFKIPFTSEERRAHPTFPLWVPTFVSFSTDELYAWWIESLNLDADIVGTPNSDAIHTMALELSQAFQLAYRDDALGHSLIVQHLTEYYEQ